MRGKGGLELLGLFAAGGAVLGVPPCPCSLLPVLSVMLPTGMGSCPGDLLLAAWLGSRAGATRCHLGMW